MTVDWTKLISTLETGLSLVQKIAPEAALGGPTAALIGNVVGSVAGLANGYLAQATAAEAVIESTDLAQVQALTAALVAQNDALAVVVAGS